MRLEVETSTEDFPGGPILFEIPSNKGRMVEGGDGIWLDFECFCRPEPRLFEVKAMKSHVRQPIANVGRTTATHL